jgi:hypothetical protein
MTEQNILLRTGSKHAPRGRQDSAMNKLDINPEGELHLPTENDRAHVHRGATRISIGGLLLCAGLAAAESEEIVMKSLDPPVMLSENLEFKTWEAPSRWSRTYYVAQKHAAAADSNPGTREQPFQTIGRAAEVLQPGERVVVAEGIYREHVRAPRGGTGPGTMIGYEAEPGARVVIRGSEIFSEQWTPVKDRKQVWQTTLAPKYFKGYKPFVADWRAKPIPEDQADYNPFALLNLVLDTKGAVEYWSRLKGQRPFNLTRGLVFQNGKRLLQVKTDGELDAGDGRYRVDIERQRLFMRPFDNADPNKVNVEIATRVACFSGATVGLGFIRVKGFTMEHTASPFPVPQIGAISTWRGHHWIIEDNTVRQSNSLGIDGGLQTFFGGLKQAPKDKRGRHIIRRNRVTDCGICGICSAGSTLETLIEDNVLLRNAWHPAVALPETGAIKTHHNIRTLIRRNLIVDTLNGDGIWMDYGNENSRCSRNVIVSTRSGRGGIFIEASKTPNLIDSNFIWGSVRIGRDGGAGIWEKYGINQIFAHNFICGNQGEAFHIAGGPVKRRSYGHYDWPAGPHKVRNNICVGNGGAYNIDGPRDVSGDMTTGITYTFDPQKLELTWSVEGTPPPCDPVEWVTRDFFDAPRDSGKTTPGPFATLPSEKQTIALAFADAPSDAVTVYPAPDGTPVTRDDTEAKGRRTRTHEKTQKK